MYGGPPHGGYPPYNHSQPYGQQPYTQQGWSAPVSGAGGFPSQPQQTSHNHSAKRQKSNPVIQRYAPPPGYVPPPNAVLPPYPGYAQGWQQPQGYPPQGWHPPQGYQTPSHTPQGYPQPGLHSQTYGQYPSYQPGYQPQPYPHQGYAQQSYPPPQGHYGAQQHHQAHANPPSDGRHTPSQQHERGSGESSARSNTHAIHASEMRPPGPTQRSNSSKKEGRPKPDDYSYDIPCTWDDLDANDNGYGNEKALWPKTNEDIDQRFSLGLILWYPAKEATRAIKPTWQSAQAQERVDGLNLPSLGNGNSVSEYFRTDNAYHAYLDVRQTDDWETDQHDPIFTDLSSQGTWIPLQDIIDLKARPDEHDYEDVYDNIWEDFMAAQTDLENSEGASPRSDRDAKSDSTSNQHEESRRRPYRYDSPGQEDTLTRLGVEGAAKPLSPRSRGVSPRHLEDAHRLNEQVDRSRDPSLSHSRPRTSSPQFKYAQHQDEHRPSRRNHSAESRSRRSSNASQHTIAGSDFGAVEDVTTPRTNGTPSVVLTPPPDARSNSDRRVSNSNEMARKRSYHDFSESSRRPKDAVPRKKPSLPESRNAYSRRW